MEGSVPGPLLLPFGLSVLPAVYPLYARNRSAFGEADHRRGIGALPNARSPTATTGRRASACRLANVRSDSASRAGSCDHTHAGRCPISVASMSLTPPGVRNHQPRRFATPPLLQLIMPPCP